MLLPELLYNVYKLIISPTQWTLSVSTWHSVSRIILEFSDRPFSTCFTRLDILIPYVCPNPSSKVNNYPVPKHTGELLVSLVGLSNH